MSAVKKRAKIIIGSAAAALCVVAAFLYAMAPLGAEVTVLASQTARLTFTEQGKYTYTNTFVVHSLVAGEVLAVPLEEGDTVRAGEVLAVISASDYEYQLRQLRSTVDAYNAQIQNLSLQEQQERDTLSGTLQELRGQMVTLDAQIKNQTPLNESLTEQTILQQSLVRQAAESLEYAEDLLDDIKDMYRGGQLGYSSVAEAEQAVTTARSNFFAARVTLEQLRAGGTPEGVLEGQRQSLQAQIDTVSARMSKSYSSAMAQYYAAQISGTNAMISQMEEKAGQATITSPMDGVVELLPVADTNLVGQAGAVAQIGSDALVEVYAPLREIDNVKTGDPVELILDKRLGEETLRGTVVLVESKAQERLSALGVAESKVRVLVRPDDGGLLIGHEMDVKFSVYEQPGAIVIPKTALFSDNGTDYVWAVVDGRAELRAVTKGVETREGYIIDSGLGEEEAVVTDANNDQLKPGKRV